MDGLLKRVLGPDLYAKCMVGGNGTELVRRYNELANRPCSVDEFKDLCGVGGDITKCITPLEEFKWANLGEELFDQCTTTYPTPLPVANLKATAKALNLPVHKVLLACRMENITLSAGSFKLTNSDLLAAENKHKTYSKDRALGGGTYGDVKIDVSRNVAIKELKKIDLNELDVLMRFRHPNVIFALDFYFEKSVLNLVLPLARCDLNSIHDLALFDAPGEETKKRFVHELISAMAFLQSQGFFHCDLKPGNVLLFPKDGTSTSTSRSLDDYKVVLADMSLCYPFTFEKERTNACGSIAFNGFERQNSQLYFDQATLNKYQSYLNVPGTVLANDMFLLGNVCFYILKNRYIHSLSRGFKDDVVKHLDNPIKYLNDMLGEDATKWYPFFSPLFKASPRDRPTSYAELVELLPSPRNDTIVTGFAEYNNLVGDFAVLSDREKFLLGKATHEVYVAIYEFKPPHYRHEVMFTAAQLLYRFWSKGRGQLKIMDCVYGCVYIALHLSGFIYPISNQYIEYVKVIAIALNGQLRYPYIMELMKTKKDIITLLDIAKTDPDRFIRVLRNPVASEFGSLSELSIVADQDSVREVESILRVPVGTLFCAICNGDHIDHELPCGHTVHASCFTNYINTQNKFRCPSCNLKLDYVVPVLIEKYLVEKWTETTHRKHAFTLWIDSNMVSRQVRKVYAYQMKKEELNLPNDQLLALRWKRFHQVIPNVPYEVWLKLPSILFRTAHMRPPFYNNTQLNTLGASYFQQPERTHEIFQILSNGVTNVNGALELIDGLTKHNPRALSQALQAIGTGGNAEAVELLFLTVINSSGIVPDPNPQKQLEANERLYNLLVAGDVGSKLLEDITDYVPHYMTEVVAGYKADHVYKITIESLKSDPIFIALASNDTSTLAVLFNKEHTQKYEADPIRYDYLKTLVLIVYYKGVSIPEGIMDYFGILY
jgi:serine/threonine protein kinase